jgi:predicted flap endonuclease-1-like 5' DNA nuclease
MDHSTRNLSVITLLTLAIFLGLNHIVQRAALGDWGLVLLFLLLAVGIWFYDRVSRRGLDDSETADTLIEPVSYEHHAEAIAIPESISLAAPIESAPPASPEAPKVIELHEPIKAEAPAPAPSPVAAAVEEKAVPSVIPPVPEPKLSVKATASQPDDLKLIEGIGPKMEKALHAAGITTFAMLAGASETQIRDAIAAAGMRFAPSVPTWAEQASFAANGDFVGLEAYQKTLVSGRKAK